VSGSLLAGWFIAALQSPEVKQKLLVQGLYPSRIRGDTYSAFLRAESQDVGRTVSEAHLKAE